LPSTADLARLGRARLEIMAASGREILDIHRLLAKSGDNSVAFLLAAMIVVGRHPRLRAGMGQDLGADPFVLGQDEIRPAERIGRTRAEVAEIPNRRGHDVQAGRKPLRVHCNRCIASDRQCSKSAIALR
jgi:hypothetical protein